MSELDNHDSADAATEQTELVGRREAITRFAMYTAPIMLAVLISSEAKAVCPVSNPGC